MSTRTFCDICDRQLEAGENCMLLGQRIKLDKQVSGPSGSLRVGIELILGVGDTSAIRWNAGALCRRCVFELLEPLRAAALDGGQDDRT